jgi:YHS domain-containing protein
VKIMARKCKCQICSKELTNDKAFKVEINGRRKYYCSEEEYNDYVKQQDERQHCLDIVAKYMRLKFATPYIQKEINKLKEYYDYIVIEKCFKENESTISWFLDNNDNSSEFGKCRYVFTIIQNNINKTDKKHKKELEEMKQMFKENQNNIDIDIMNISETQTTRPIADISSFLD